jgi:hypothetical protein
VPPPFRSWNGGGRGSDHSFNGERHNREVEIAAGVNIEDEDEV